GDRLAATASSLPDHDAIFVSRQSANAVGPGVNSQGIIVSRTFRETGGSGAEPTILDLGDIPGLQTGWRVGPASQPFVFTASRGTSVDNMMTSSTAIQFAAATQRGDGSSRVRSRLESDDSVVLLGE